MSNPEHNIYDSSSVFFFSAIFDDAVMSAAEEIDYKKGTVLAFNATTGKYEQTKSGTAAVANAKTILAQDVSFSAAGDKTVRILIGGQVDEDQLIWDGTDSPETIPAGAADSFQLQLRAYGILLRPLAQQSFEII